MREEGGVSGGGGEDMITNLLLLCFAPFYALGYTLGVAWKVARNGWVDGQC